MKTFDEEMAAFEAALKSLSLWDCGIRAEHHPGQLAVRLELGGEPLAYLGMGHEDVRATVLRHCVAVLLMGSFRPLEDRQLTAAYHDLCSVLAWAVDGQPVTVEMVARAVREIVKREGCVKIAMSEFIWQDRLVRLEDGSVLVSAWGKHDDFDFGAAVAPNGAFAFNAGGKVLDVQPDAHDDRHLILWTSQGPFIFVGGFRGWPVCIVKIGVSGAA